MFCDHQNTLKRVIVTLGQHNQMTENPVQTQRITWKPNEREPQRERFHYNNGDYNGVL